MAICKYCSAEIEWWNDDGAWVPLTPETGERHRCLNRGRRTGSGYNDGYRDGYQRGYLEGMTAGQTAEASRKPGTLHLNQPDVLKLLQLCHPDHQPEERRAVATSVTARLNELLSEFRT